jgi:hypothetical protein
MTDVSDPRVMIRRQWIIRTNARIEAHNTRSKQQNSVKSRLQVLTARHQASRIARLTGTPGAKPLPVAKEMTLSTILDPKIREQVRDLDSALPAEGVRDCYNALMLMQGNVESARALLVANRETKEMEKREEDEKSGEGDDEEESSSSSPSSSSPSSGTTKDRDVGSMLRSGSRIPRWKGARDREKDTKRSKSPKRGRFDSKSKITSRAETRRGVRPDDLGKGARKTR